MSCQQTRRQFLKDGLTAISMFGFPNIVHAGVLSRPGLWLHWHRSLQIEDYRQVVLNAIL